VYSDINLRKKPGEIEKQSAHIEKSFSGGVALICSIYPDINIRKSTGESKKTDAARICSNS
jgi:hypothetical protein